MTSRSATPTAVCTTDSLPMRRPCPSPAGRGHVTGARVCPRPAALQLPLSAWHSHPLPSLPPPSMPSPDRLSNPIIRWFRSSTSKPSTPPTHSREPSRTPSPLASLHDALSSDLLRPPQAVHSLYPNAHSDPHRHAYLDSFRYSPPLLRSLAHTTLPIASLTYSTQPGEDGLGIPHTDESKPLRQPLPTRSSLDTLRSIHSQASPSSLPSPARSPSRSPSDLRSFPTSLVPSWWGNKEQVDELLAEDERADTMEREQEYMRTKYLAPRNPIVFCHGLMGFDTVTIGPSIAPLEVTHWRGIKEVLESNGCEVLITRVPATSSPGERAKVLEQCIEKVYPGRAIHLIGHSMGGLDCRWLTTHLTNHTFSVLSVTTIASPHRGSEFATHFLETLGRQRLQSLISFLEMLPIGDGDGSAFESLTPDAMRKFNDCTPDKPGVRYFSWGASYDPGLIDTWKWPHSVILEREGPNDGLVSVESARWGTYLGTLTDVNHLDLVGWINTARYKWAEFRGREIQFKPATFYLGAADLLAREVEGQAPLKRDDQSEEEAGPTGAVTGTTGVEELGRQVANEGSNKPSSQIQDQTPIRYRKRVEMDRRTMSEDRLLHDDDPWDAHSEGPASPPRNT